MTTSSKFPIGTRVTFIGGVIFETEDGKPLLGVVVECSQKPTCRCLSLGGPYVHTKWLNGLNLIKTKVYVDHVNSIDLYRIRRTMTW